jgi:hypothetical protein
MTTTTPGPLDSTDSGTRARMCQLLTREQSFAPERLHRLLDRRDAVDAGSLIPAEDQAWLVHALDAAIVSYYRLARTLNLDAEADAFLHGYRHMGLASRPYINPRINQRHIPPGGVEAHAWHQEGST